MTFPDTVDDQLLVEGLNLRTIRDYTLTTVNDAVGNLVGNWNINGTPAVHQSDLPITNIMDFDAYPDGGEYRDQIHEAITSSPRGATLWFPGPGDYNLRAPLQARSDLKLLGAPGARLVNTHPGLSGQFATTTVIFPGQFHPNWLHTIVDGTMNYDSINSVAWGSTTITRTSTDLSLSVGQVIMIYVANPSQFPYLRRILEINGNDLLLHKPIDFDWSASTCYITDGTGDGINITPVTGGDLYYGSRFVENFHMEGFELVSQAGYPFAMSACLDGTFKNLTIDASAMIYGNAWTDCRFENFRGRYRVRFIEMTDGARNNVISDIKGTCIDKGQSLASDAGVVLGVGDILENFEMNEGRVRGGSTIRLVTDRMTIRNGKINVLSPTNPYSIVETSLDVKDARFENVDINIKSQVTDIVFVIRDINNVYITNVNVNALGGYATAGSVMTLNEGVERCFIDGFNAPSGRIDIASAFPETSQDLIINNSHFQNIITGQNQKIPGWIKGKNTSIQKRREIEKLSGLLQAQELVITATTETTAVSYAFVADQDLNVGEGLTLYIDTNKAGTAGDGRVKVTIFGVVPIDFTIPAATTGGYVIELNIYKENKTFSSDIFASNIKYFSPATIATTNGRHSGADLSIGQGITVAAWKLNAADTFTLRRVKVVPNLALF